VREVIDTVGQVTGRQVDWELVDRRPGDPASVVGAVDRIAAELDWRAEVDLTGMISGAWQAWPHQT